MGFTLYYRSTRQVPPVEAVAIKQAAEELVRGHTWLSCEPLSFFPGAHGGHLFGGSKPNFQPHPDDAAAAAKEGLPDGTTQDLMAILCKLSQSHGIDWEISHDYSDGPVGYIRDGICDREVLAQTEAFAGIGALLGSALEEDESATSPGPDDDDDEPAILKFMPKGS